MTAGSGIIHQEMPEGNKYGQMHGFQLWANLPASNKMMDPRYREFAAGKIPEITLKNGVAVRVIAGKVNGAEGPVKDVVIDPEFLDVSVPAGSELNHIVKRGHGVFAYVIEGEGFFGKDMSKSLGNGMLALFEDGEEVEAFAKTGNFRFLLISGKPLKEPIAWGGPIVMNTRDELRVAFEEYSKGTFIKHSG
jgi:redox-sensitive bicupin YhaK (pirin superfamily)